MSEAHLTQTQQGCSVVMNDSDYQGSSTLESRRNFWPLVIWTAMLALDIVQALFGVLAYFGVDQDSECVKRAMSVIHFTPVGKAAQILVIIMTCLCIIQQMMLGQAWFQMYFVFLTMDSPASALRLLKSSIMPYHIFDVLGWTTIIAMQATYIPRGFDVCIGARQPQQCTMVKLTWCVGIAYVAVHFVGLTWAWVLYRKFKREDRAVASYMPLAQHSEGNDLPRPSVDVEVGVCKVCKSKMSSDS